MWAVAVGTNMMGYTPVFGQEVRFVLLGGGNRIRNPAPMVRVARVVLPVHHRHFHGDPLLACPQGRRHLWTALIGG